MENDCLESNGRCKDDPQISNSADSWEPNGAPDKKEVLFSMEKNEAKEVNTHGTFILGHLPVKKFTAVVTSEKLSSFM